VVLAPEEALNRVQLIKTSTSWAAAYMLKDKELGTLEPGKLADFVVFNKDYFTIPEAEIPTVIPLLVVVGGKTIVLREELATELGMGKVGPQLKFTYEIQSQAGGELARRLANRQARRGIEKRWRSPRNESRESLATKPGCNAGRRARG
jgi:hypothetical protein